MVGLTLAMTAAEIAGGAVFGSLAPVAAEVRERLERDGDRVTDPHLWRVGPGHLACIAAPVAGAPRPPSDHKVRLAGVPGLGHATVEVEPCPGEHPRSRAAA